MNSLFETEATSTAVISECGRYRYRLTRSWDADKRPACFIMLNPSTADAEQDDPTIRRCIAFAKSWNCGGIVVVNLFAWRSTDPDAMKAAAVPVGPENDRYIREAIIECDPVIAAWGVNGTHRGRDADVKRLIQRSGLPWAKCLKLSKAGHPWHPLYVRGDAKPMPFGGERS